MTERARRMAAKRGFSIALLLFLFGASLVVPALAFTAILLDRNWQAQEAEIRRRLEQLVGDLAHDVDREFTLLLAHLAALAAGRRSPVPRRRRPASDEHAGSLELLLLALLLAVAVGRLVARPIAVASLLAAAGNCRLAEAFLDAS